MRDLGGSGALHRLNPATNQFEAVSEDASEMVQVLRSGTGLPAKTTWEQLFTLTASQLPTRRPKPAVKACGVAKSVPKMPQNQWNMDTAAPEAPSPEELARLPELMEELKTSKRAAQIQFKLDGVSSELFELESKTKAWDSVSQRLSAVRAELARAEGAVAGLPPDIMARAIRFPEDQKKIEAQISRIRDEQQFMAENAPLPPTPLQRDQRFVGATALGALLFGAGIFVEGSYRYVSLLAMVPFTVAAFFALRFIEEWQAFGRQGGKSEVLASREKKLTHDFQAAATAMNAVFAQVGASNLEEFLPVLGKREVLHKELAALEHEADAVRNNPEYRSLSQKIAALKAEQDKGNQELSEMSAGYVRDASDIERDIARLRAPPPKAAPAPQAVEPKVEVVAAEEAWVDPSPAMLTLASDVLTTDIPTLWVGLQARVAQYLVALTDRRYQDMAVDKDGRARLKAGEKLTAVSSLPGADADLAYLALRLAVVEKLGPSHKVPFIIEDTFESLLEGAKQPLFGRMAKHLGTLTQVLHVSGTAHTGSLADPPIAI